MDALPGSSWLGFGFNLLGAYSTDACTTRILVPTAAGQGTFTYGGNTYAVPTGVTVSQGSGNTMLDGTATVAESLREVETHFAAKAGIKGTYGNFSGSIDALYESDSSNESSVWYGLVEGRLEGFVMAVDELKPSDDFLAEPDVKALLALQNPTFDPAKPEPFFRIFRRFGTHLVSQLSMGAGIEYAASIDRTAATDKETASAKLQLEYKAVVADASAQAQVDWNSLTTDWSKHRSVSIAATGGSADLMAGLDPTFGGTFSAAFTQWLQTVGPDPGVIDLRLQPLSMLFSGDLADAVDRAIAAFVDNGAYVEAVIGALTTSGLIEVSHAVAPQTAPATPEGGMQLVVVDATTLAVVYNQTGYYAGGDPAPIWASVFSGAASYTSSRYIACLTVFAWKTGGLPTRDAQRWLEGFGASLQAWQDAVNAGDTDAPATYAFIGQGGLQPGQALEQFAATDGKSAFASVTSPFVPSIDGGYLLPGAAASSLAGAAS